MARAVLRGARQVLHGLRGPPSKSQLAEFLAVRQDSAKQLVLMQQPEPEPEPPPALALAPQPVRTDEGTVVVPPPRARTKAENERLQREADQAEGAAAVAAARLAEVRRLGVGGQVALDVAANAAAAAVAATEAAAAAVVPSAFVPDTRGQTRLYTSDMKRYSQHFGNKLLAAGRDKTIRHCGALALQRKAMNNGGVYRKQERQVRVESETTAALYRPGKEHWDEIDFALARAAAPQSWSQPPIKDYVPAEDGAPAADDAELLALADEGEGGAPAGGPGEGGSSLDGALLADHDRTGGRASASPGSEVLDKDWVRSHLPLPRF
jgi:hypothetical protein